MKKIWALLCCLSVLLCGCAASDGGGSEEGEGTTVCDHTARFAYYEELAETLEREILALKAELYVNRVEYEAELERLEAELESIRGEVQPPDEELPAGGEITVSPESDFRYTVGNGVVTVTQYVGKDREVRIPSTLGGYPVRVIGDRAFADLVSPVSVTVPDGVTQIGWFGFSGCVMLERVALPASVTSIAYGAFQNCRQDLTLICPDGSYAEQYARSYGFAVERE